MSKRHEELRRNPSNRASSDVGVLDEEVATKAETVEPSSLGVDGHDMEEHAQDERTGISIVIDRADGDEGCNQDGNDDPKVTRYRDEEIRLLEHVTQKRKQKNDSFWKKTYILKYLKHRAQRIGHEAASKEGNAHFKKAVLKVLELSIDPAYRTDDTLDLNRFLNAQFTRIADTVDRCIFAPRKEDRSHVRRALSEFWEHVDQTTTTTDTTPPPPHVTAVVVVLVDYAAALRHRLERLCRTTALTKAQEHWRDRLPLVFVLSSSLLGLKVVDDVRVVLAPGDGSRENAYVHYLATAAALLAYVMAHVLVYLRVPQSIYGDALKGAQEFYAKFKDSIPDLLRELGGGGATPPRGC